ncbi:YdcF family protein [Pendulispora rubella]|uniref:peptidylprolyl isomerase n=1 Tax=Pendulispora rubella TaxID=2741070 RepID=A0ABZ2KZY7_9BACT
MTAPAMVVLGCKLVFDAGGRLTGAAGRRAEAAAQAWKAPAVIVVSGGRMWNGVVEADALATALAERGVPKEYIVRERCSFHTVDNARFSAVLLERRGIREVSLVTCDWHLPRARRIFQRQGLSVHEVPAKSPPPGVRRRVWRWGRERVAEWLALWTSLALAMMLGACKKSEPPAQVDASVQAGVETPPEFAVIDRAADRRRASEVPAVALGHADVRVRRRAARAFARIADEASLPGLLRAVADQDEDVVAWASYGLGFACKGHEEAHVNALLTRAGAFPDGGTRATVGPEEADVRIALPRALGKCGGAAAESQLVAWVKARGPWAEGAAYGLGDVASRAGSLPGGAVSPASSLNDEAIGALLDAASSVPSALFGLGRIKRLPDPLVPRLLDVARASLPNATPERIFTVRALAHAGPAAAGELAKIVRERSFSAAERAEAARGLGLMDASGRTAGEAIAELAKPLTDPMALMALAGDEFGVLMTLLDALHGEVPKAAEPALKALAALTGPGEVPKVLGRRLAALRCAAAGALAKDAYDNELLARCDAKGTPVYEQARLASLLRKPLAGERKNAWLALTKSENLRVRELALEALEGHPELGDAARAAVTAALRSGKAGLVGTAADAIVAHPERMAGLGPALSEALDVRWGEDLLETRAGLIDAAVALRVERARAVAEAACKDPNAMLRQRAAKALGKLDAPPPRPSPGGGGSPGCPAPAVEPSLASELDRPLAEPAKVVFETDAGRLAIVFDPTLAPVTATRLVALAQNGFFKEMLVHRVVPGFVAQFGDPGGDGYGGSGQTLRCETSPVPFEPLSVGMALSGRDTGSSQIFVTLSRTPHLDGQYTRVGRAEGDWAAVAQGDVIHDARVER